MIIAVYVWLTAVSGAEHVLTYMLEEECRARAESKALVKEQGFMMYLSALSFIRDFLILGSPNFK